MLVLSLAALVVAALAVLVAVKSYRLGLKNARVARDAPGLARQQQLRDELRAVVEPLVAEFRAVAERVRQAEDAGSVPASIVGMRERLNGVAERLADQQEASRVRSLALRFLTARLAWSEAARAEASLASHIRRYPVLSEEPENVSDREQLGRKRDRAQTDLTAEADQAAEGCAELVRYLDGHDRRLAGGV